jgi:hypothetical protein
VSEVFTVQYTRTVTPYKEGDQVPIMRRDRAEALVARGVAVAVDWEPGESEMPAPKTLAELNTEEGRAEAQRQADLRDECVDRLPKAPDGPLNDKQIRHPGRSPIRPIRK